MATKMILKIGSSVQIDGITFQIVSASNVSGQMLYLLDSGNYYTESQLLGFYDKTIQLMSIYIDEIQKKILQLEAFTVEPDPLLTEIDISKINISESEKAFAAKNDIRNKASQLIISSQEIVAKLTEGVTVE